MSRGWQGHEKLLFWVLAVTVAGMALLVCLGGFVYRDLRLTQDRNYRTGVQNRAVDCRTLVGLGLPLSPTGPCSDPAVLEHYDPKEPSPLLESQAVDRRLACEGLRLAGGTDTACDAA